MMGNMRPSPMPAKTRLITMVVVEVAVATRSQAARKGKAARIIALFLPR